MSQFYTTTKATNIEGCVEYIYDTYKGNTGKTITTYDDRACPIKFVQDKVIIGRRYCFRGFHGDNKTYKLFTCLSGEVKLWVVDCRRDSPTFRQKFCTKLSRKKIGSILVPPGCINAHAGMTDDYVLMYKWSEYYDGPDSQVTVAWDDPDINIAEDHFVYLPTLSERDQKGLPLRSVWF